ncbi:MAG: methyltransferase domain-containing protein [Eudoraea sp.]|nr:methyltransferase domain-containing protein [Eudoraea sp.]NNJ41196.1 methyltransferase domain-containing protein [Eudoraea sp.]
MKKTVLIIFFGSLLACQGQQHKKEHAPGTANEYMHQSSVEELAERFESPERDAYQKPEKVLAFLGDISGKKIMDIGAGSGYFSVKLAKKGALVIAADVNEEFQAVIKERIEKEQLENLTTRKIPYDSPGLEDKEVDMVLVVNTYHHIENRPDYFAIVKKGLKNKGKLVIIDFFDADIPVGPRHQKISIDTVISELKKAGYTHFQVEVNLLPYQYIISSKIE